MAEELFNKLVEKRGKNYMKNKVIGWNINQRSGMGNNIPQFVIDELIAKDADIVVLTELFKTDTINYFWDEMERAGYAYAITQNDGTNEVEILWKKDSYSMALVDNSVITKKDNNNPNMLLVDLVDKKGKILTVVGFRIRMVDYSERAAELEIVINKANQKENPVLMVTDCNNLRRETVETSWNLNVVDCILAENGFQRHTPCGQSIYTEKSDRGYAYEFAEDHIITRNLVVDLGDYDRSFVNRDKNAYPWGKDFQIYDIRTGNKISIKPGIPDHAIVQGYIDFKEKHHE